MHATQRSCILSFSPLGATQNASETLREVEAGQPATVTVNIEDVRHLDGLIEIVEGQRT